MGEVRLAGVVDAELDMARVADAVADGRCGAVVTFAGMVRNHDHGVAVAGIDYSAHPDAGVELRAVASEIAVMAGVHAVAVQHRTGRLSVGDLAMSVAVAAEHRGQAFAAASELVDQVKARVPIWKRQTLADGTYEWSNLP